MPERVEQMLKQIRSMGPGLWDSTKVSAFVKEQTPQLSYEERLELAKGLVKRDIFLWLDYVSEEIRNLASTDTQYIDFLSELIAKVRRDLAGGQIINALIYVGESDPGLGIDISLAMRKREEESLTIYSSFPLGGAGRIDLSKVRPVLDKLWQSGDPLKQVAALRTYRVILDPVGGQSKRVSDSIFQLFETAASSHNIEVRKEAAQALFDAAGADEQRSMGTLTRLLGESGPIRSLIASRLQIKNDFSKENRATLLKLIVQDDDDGVLSQAAMVLMFHGKDFQHEAMEMIISIAERGKYRSVRELDYAAEQVAKVDLAASIKMVEKTFTMTSSDHFKFVAPYLLIDISKSNYLILADFVKTWLRNEKFEKMAIKTAREMLGYVFGTGDQTVADSLYPTLESIAIEKEIEVQSITKGESDKVAQCIEMLTVIERGRPRLDYDEIEKNWLKYASLKEFLGDRWIRERKSEDNRIHEILYNLAYLSRESELEDLLKQTPKDLDPFKLWARSMRARGLLWPRAMLGYLNAMAEVVKNLPKTGGLKERLRQDDQYYEAFSELQIISSFVVAGFQVDIEPKLGSKRLDLETVIEGSKVLFEVKNPDRLRKLKYSSGAVTMPNRARPIIHDEFTQHLAQVPHEERRPVVIVMDIGRSQINYDFIADYLFGTLQFTFWRDRKTGKVVDKGWTRAEDSLHKQAEKTSENLDLISAVVCYKTLLRDGAKFHLQGTMFLNPTAQNPLTNVQSEKISEVLFGVGRQETDEEKQ